MSKGNFPDKQSLLEERKKKWNESRQVNSFTEQVHKEIKEDRKHTSLDEVKQDDSARSYYKKSYNPTDDFLNKMTEKLSVHIRDEIQKELNNNISSNDIRDSVSNKMESYLTAELSTHTCKICFELMTSPLNTPVLLFPCGHTFCKQCVDRVVNGDGTSGSSTQQGRGRGSSEVKGCPYCRTPIQSKAVNQSLKDLIDQFARQKDMVQNGKNTQLDDIFQSNNNSNSSPNSRNNSNKYNTSGNNGSSYSGSGGQSNSNRGSGTNTSASGSNNSNNSNNGTSSNTTSHYQAQYRNCEMRYTILYNELTENKLEMQLLHKKKSKIQSASDHLLDEKNKLDERIKLLQEERQLIDKHLDNQIVKQNEVKEVETSLSEKLTLLKSTLTNLEAEMEKLQLLIEGTKAR